MNSEHNIQLCLQCALPVATIMALWQLLNSFIYIYLNCVTVKDLMSTRNLITRRALSATFHNLLIDDCLRFRMTKNLLIKQRQSTRKPKQQRIHTSPYLFTPNPIPTCMLWKEESKERNNLVQPPIQQKCSHQRRTSLSQDP